MWPIIVFVFVGCLYRMPERIAGQKIVLPLPHALNVISWRIL